MKWNEMKYNANAVTIYTQENITHFWRMNKSHQKNIVFGFELRTKHWENEMKYTTKYYLFKFWTSEITTELLKNGMGKLCKMILFLMYSVIHWNDILLADQTSRNESGPKTAWNFTCSREIHFFDIAKYNEATKNCDTTVIKKRAMTSKEPSSQVMPRAIVSFPFWFWFWFHFVTVVHKRNSCWTWKKSDTKIKFDFRDHWMALRNPHSNEMNHWMNAKKLSFVFDANEAMTPRLNQFSVSLADWLQTFAFLCHFVYLLFVRTVNCIFVWCMFQCSPCGFCVIQS